MICPEEILYLLDKIMDYQCQNLIENHWQLHSTSLFNYALLKVILSYIIVVEFI